MSPGPGAPSDQFSGIPVAAAAGPESLGVIINSNDPLSERIGAYYAQRRHIPAENVVRELRKIIDTRAYAAHEAASAAF